MVLATVQVDAILKALGDNCQSVLLFNDPIADATGWIVLNGLGVQIRVDGVNFPNEIEYDRLGNFFPGRLNKLLDVSNPTIDSFGNIKLEFKYNHTFFEQGGGNGGMLMGLTDSTGRIMNAKRLGARHTGLGGQLQLQAQMSDLSTTITSARVSIPTGVSYITVEKIGTNIKLTAFSDQARTISIGASPLVSVAGLNQITFNQVGASGNDTGIGLGLETGRLDDIQIFKGCSGNFTVDSCLQGPVKKQFTVDAIIKQLGVVETFQVDALIKQVNGQCGVDLTGLVAYWNMDQASGTATNDAGAIGSPDSGGSDWNLISLGGHTFLQAGIVGTSVDSNGISSGQWRTSSTITSLASFITNKATTAGWTINYWLKYDATGSAFVYILNSAGSGGSNIGNEHFMVQGGVLRARVRQFNSGNGEVYSPSSTLPLPNDTNFHMYTIGYDKTTNEIIYAVDGVSQRLANTGTAVGTSSGNQSLRIFGRAASPTGFFDGKFDEGSIWKRTLTDFEIQQLFALNNNGIELQQGGKGGATCFTVNAIIKSLGVNGCGSNFFTTDFSSSTGWVPVANDVGGVSVTGGQLTGWGSDGGITREIFYDLVTNNGVTISDTNWIAEFDFQYNVPPTSTNPGHSPFTLSDSIATTDSFQTAGPATPSVPHPRSISMIVGNFNTFSIDRGVQIQVKDTTTASRSSVGGTLLAGIIDLDAFANITVFPRLERTSATTYKLSVFTDSARTIHVTGTASGADSPITLTASQVVTSTNFIHSSNNSAGGSGRVLGGFLDNLSILSGGVTNPILLSDNFVTDNWNDQGTKIQVNTGTQVIDVDGSTDGLLNSTAFDLGTPVSDTNWNLRFKLDVTATAFSTQNVAIRIGLFDSDQTVSSATPHEAIAIDYNVQNTTGIRRYVSRGIEGIVTFGNSASWLTGFGLATHFVEIIRNSATSVTLNVYSDSAFTTLIGTDTFVIPATIGGLRFIRVTNSDATNVGGTLTATIDDVLLTSVATGAGCPTVAVDACLLGVGQQETFSVDAIVANILSSQLDLTWQYREHETNASFPPGMFWTDSASLRMFTNPSSVGVAYTLKTFKLSEITGSDIKATWKRTLGNSGQAQIRVYDGTINAESLIDIPPLGSIPNTLLGILFTPSFFLTFQTDTLLASNIDYAGATGDIITVIFLQNDGSTSSNMQLNINEVEVGTRVWDFTNGLVITNIRGNQLVNFTDKDDFGYINASSVFARFSTTFSIDANLLARICSPWKKFNEADGSSLRVTINAGDAQGSEIPQVTVPTTVTGIKCSVKSASTQGFVRMRIVTFPQSQLANGNFLGIPNGISTNQVIMNSLSSSVFSDFTFTFNSPCLLPGQRYMIIFDDFINNVPGMDYETILTSTKDYRQYAVTYRDPGSGTPAKFARVISRNRAPAVDIEVAGEPTLVCPLISAIIVDEAVWEFREVRDNNGQLTNPPNAILTTEPPRLRVRTEAFSSSNTWLFKSFKKTDITGNSILLEGDNNGNTEIRVYDGQYQRDRFGDFEPANGAQPATPLKGIGLLGIVGSNPLVTSLLLPASSINYAGSTEEFITVFINNRDQVNLTAQNLDISAITMSPFRKWNFSNPTVVTESTAFGGESDWGFVRASSTEQPFMTTDFALDACVGLFAGRRSRIGDIIIIVLRANPNSTGREVVDLVNIYTEANNLAFVGTTSRVKNWMGFLGATLGLIQEDNSDPDWYETKWISLI